MQIGPYAQVIKIAVLFSSFLSSSGNLKSWENDTIASYEKRKADVENLIVIYPFLMETSANSVERLKRENQFLRLFRKLFQVSTKNAPLAEE